MIASRDEEWLERLGQLFVDAIAARDFHALRALMAEDLRFRLLVPKGPQAQVGADETVGRFDGWFADSDELRLEASDVHAVADRVSVMYRLRLHDAGGWRVIEQHLFADAAPDKGLRAIDLLCSGFHAVRPQPVDVGNLTLQTALRPEGTTDRKEEQWA